MSLGQKAFLAAKKHKTIKIRRLVLSKSMIIHLVQCVRVHMTYYSDYSLYVIFCGKRRMTCKL